VPRYKLTIAYDGTNFCGWQKQEPPAHAILPTDKIIPPHAPHSHHHPHGPQEAEQLEDPLAAAPLPDTPTPDSRDEAGAPANEIARVQLRTVQEVVERAVREVVREPIVLIGASRTDSGVHARGQVGAFTCRDERWPIERGTEPLLRAINARLPEDVVVVACEAASPTFDPIGDCVSKGYTYSFHVSRDRPLRDRHYVHHVWSPLDVARMNDAAARLVGEHDFAAFAAAGHGRLSTVRTIHECRVEESTFAASSFVPLCLRPSALSSRVMLHISGSGFLWNMVRIIAGTLYDVGRGKMEPEQVTRALTEKDRRLAGPTMPARGLCLEWVRYDPSTT
jgi:tRNA pseudouridine38-40 synthase